MDFVGVWVVHTWGSPKKRRVSKICHRQPVTGCFASRICIVIYSNTCKKKIMVWIVLYSRVLHFFVWCIINMTIYIYIYTCISYIIILWLWLLLPVNRINIYANIVYIYKHWFERWHGSASPRRVVLFSFGRVLGRVGHRNQQKQMGLFENRHMFCDWTEHLFLILRGRMMK